MAKEKESKGKTNDYNKIQTQEYPKNYYTGDLDNAEGQKEFAAANKELDQSELNKLNKKLKTELEKGEKPKFEFKK